MKYIFGFVVMIHGLIHLMGLGNAFGLTKLPALTKYIAKPTGLLWLLAALLFILSAVIYLLKKENWALFAVAAVVLSQLLIVWYWQDAKMGTMVNIIVLLVALPALGEWQFKRTCKKEVEHLLSQPTNTNTAIITNEQLLHLPSIVQKWLSTSGIVGLPAIKQVYLQQHGKMKNTTAAEWIPFDAEQYFTTDPSSFLWKTKIQPSRFLFITGRDKYEQGKGNMLIKAYGLFIIANNKGAQTDQGTLLRYLAEICWFPSAALNKNIIWEPIDDKRAKATMRYGAVTATGFFSFHENGDLQKFEAERYYISNRQSSLEKWQVSCIDHRTMNGIRIPVRNTVTWKLKDGDFTWLQLEITNIQFTFTG
ncbi:MAG: hypothetical protein GXC73_00545 [Chitinophagaceae bacterium]|nr:hypothetical protein [Chitinophagaceae bacterium]